MLRLEDQMVKHVGKDKLLSSTRSKLFSLIYFNKVNLHCSNSIAFVVIVDCSP